MFEAALVKKDMSHKLLQSAPVLIWLADVQGLCHWFNDTWFNFTGRSLEQESGNGWTEGVHPDDLAACMRGFLAALAETRPFVLEYRLLRRDGVYRWIRDHGLPFANDAERFGGYIGYCFDISDWKSAEQRLHEQKAELEASNRELKRLREAAEEQALHDPLTGLCNRRGIAMHYELQSRRCLRKGTSLSLLMLDIDRFKTINDAHGHLAGDACLKELASMLGAVLRPDDILGRFGGDEFIVLLPETGRAGALAVAAKVCRRARELSPLTSEGRPALTFTVSVGAATLTAEDRGGFDRLLQRADAALYLAKTGGRDTARMDIAIDAALDGAMDASRESTSPRGDLPPDGTELV